MNDSRLEEETEGDRHLVGRGVGLGLGLGVGVGVGVGVRVRAGARLRNGLRNRLRLGVGVGVLANARLLGGVAPPPLRASPPALAAAAIAEAEVVEGGKCHGRARVARVELGVGE